MNDSAQFLSRLPGGVRIEDMVDVLVVALILFFVVDWLRRTRSRVVPRRVLVIGVPLLTLLLLSIRLELPLLESILRLLTVVVIVSLAIVFQADLRRMVDRVGVLRGRGKRTGRAVTDTPNDLAEAVVHLARGRVGALIAVRGDDPWDSFPRSVELGGLMSKPLLYSIFAPDTPGHDGAVLIEGDRVTSFGVHLPLSPRPLAEDRESGTRHAAALGLSEEYDALVIVVSEETGTISVARDGELRRIRDESELRAVIGEFWTRHYRSGTRSRHRGVPIQGISNAVAAVLLAILAWLLFVFEPHTIQRSYLAPIVFENLPPGWVADSISAYQVRVILSGPEHFFDKVDASRFVVSYDLSRVTAGTHRYSIAPENLAIPKRLELIWAEPAIIEVKLHRYTRIDVPIEVVSTIDLPDSIALIPERPTVTLLVPDDEVVHLDRVLAGPVDLQSGFPSVLTTWLDLPEGVRLPPGVTSELRVLVDRR